MALNGIWCANVPFRSYLLPCATSPALTVTFERILCSLLLFFSKFYWVQSLSLVSYCFIDCRHL